jgi:hypothetical protein
MSPLRGLVLLALAGCFDPQIGDRPFACGQAGECPPGYGCAASVCVRAGAPDARPIATDAGLCAAGTTACDGDDLVSCAGGRPGARVTCASGCDAAVTPAACWIMTPSNIKSDACDTPGVGTLHISATQALSTDDCTGGTVLKQLRGPDLCVIKRAQIIVDAGAYVTFPGLRAPVLVATDSLQIAGTLDVSARTRVAQGGSTFDQLAGRGADVTTVGGGGGGHALRGGNSGQADGGDPIDDVAGVPLIPGGWGGGAGCTDVLCSTGVLGGAGGGAIQLVACGELVLGDTVAIRAGGGGGWGGLSDLLSGTGGGGGGAGGTILVEANTIALGAHAVLSANGGGGGGGGGDVSAGEDGHDSTNDASAAPGGMGGDVSGGAGAPGGNDARAGKATNQDFTLQVGEVNYGGGGGAPGRVELNCRPDRSVTIAGGAVVSPTTLRAPTGSIGRHHR